MREENGFHNNVGMGRPTSKLYQGDTSQIDYSKPMQSMGIPTCAHYFQIR